MRGVFSAPKLAIFSLFRAVKAKGLHDFSRSGGFDLPSDGFYGAFGVGFRALTRIFAVN
jgi:hypothetical protein